MKRGSKAQRPKSPDSDVISFSFSMSDSDEEKNQNRQPNNKLSIAKPFSAKDRGKAADKSLTMSGSDFSVDFSGELSPRTKTLPASKVKDNSAAAIMGKKIVSAVSNQKMLQKNKKALGDDASESFSISGDDIVFSDDEVPGPPTRTRAPVHQTRKGRVEMATSLSFSISGDDIIFSDDEDAPALAGGRRERSNTMKPAVTAHSKLALAKIVVVKKPSIDSRASINSDDIQFSGDSDSEEGSPHLNCSRTSGGNRRVAEASMKLTVQGKVNNRYQDDESITPSHTPSLGGSSFESEQGGGSNGNKGQRNGPHSNNEDSDQFSDYGKPNIMMGDDLADLMSSAGVNTKPTSQSKAAATEEDDPLSGMNRVIQRFSDDDDDEEPDGDDKSESFYRRYYDNSHGESKDEDEDSNDGKPNIMMGDDLVDLMLSAGLQAPPPLRPASITSKISISRSQALSSVKAASPQPQAQPMVELSASGDDLIHPVATSWAFPSTQEFTSPSSAARVLGAPATVNPPAPSQQPSFIPHQLPSQPLLLSPVKVYLTSSETQTTSNQVAGTKSGPPPGLIRPPPEVVDLDPTLLYGNHAIKQRTVALQVGGGNEVASQVTFDPRGGGSLVEDSMHRHEALHQPITGRLMKETKPGNSFNSTQGTTMGINDPQRLNRSTPFNVPGSLINGPLSSWGVLTMAVQSMKAAALMEKVQEASERQRQALETDLLLQDYASALGSWQPHHSQAQFTQAAGIRGQGTTVSFGQNLNDPLQPTAANQPNAESHVKIARPPPPGHPHTSMSLNVTLASAYKNERRRLGSDPGGSPFPPLSKSSFNARKVTSSFSQSIRSMDGSSIYDEDFEDQADEVGGLGGIQEDEEDEVEIEEVIKSEPSRMTLRSKGGSYSDDEDEEINKVAAAAAAEISRGQSLSHGSRSYSLADVYSEAFEDDAKSEAYSDDLASPYSSFASPQQQMGGHNKQRGSKACRDSSLPQPGNFPRFSTSGGGRGLEASPSSSSLHRQSASFGGSRAGSISVRRSTTFGGTDIPENNKLESLETPIRSKPLPASKPQAPRSINHKRNDSTMSRGDVPPPRPAWYDSQDVNHGQAALPPQLQPPAPPMLTPAQVTILRYHNLITSGAMEPSGLKRQGFGLPFFNTAHDGNFVDNLASSPSLAAASGLHFRAPTGDVTRPKFLTNSEDNYEPMFAPGAGAASFMDARQDLLQAASLAARGIKTFDLVGERSADNDLRAGVDKLREKLNRIKGGISIGGHSIGQGGLMTAGESLKQRAIQNLKEKLSGSNGFLGVGAGSISVERHVTVENGRLVEPQTSYQYTTLSDTLKLIERLRQS